MFTFLKNLLGFKSSPVDKVEVIKPDVYEEFTQPKFNKIEFEPVLAIKDDHLVMVLQHQFDNVPSWAEWDAERKVVTISHMNGDTDEAPLELAPQYLDVLSQKSQILLVSNDNDKKIMHYVQFLSRP